MIHTLGSMIGGPHGSTQVDFDTGRGTRCSGWVRAVPLPFYGGLFDRIGDAWAVIAGRAFAVRWPTAGELERALDGCTCSPDDEPPVPCAKKFALGECRAAAQRELDNALMRVKVTSGTAETLLEETRQIELEQFIADCKQAAAAKRS